MTDELTGRVALVTGIVVLMIGLTLINVVRRGARTWVAGTAHVTAASEAPAGAATPAQRRWVEAAAQARQEGRRLAARRERLTAPKG